MADERGKYIPPGVQQAMAGQMQNLPAHLRRYAGPDRPAYVPQHIERALSEQLQKTAPAHLRQYANAYVQQHVTQPGFSQPAARAAPHPPVPDLLRLDHSIAGAGQYTADPSALPKSRLGYQPGQTSTMSAASPPTGQEQPLTDPYNFITDAGVPQKRASRLSLGGGSRAQRLLLVVGGAAIALIIVIAIANAMLGSNVSSGGLTKLAEQQTELVRVAGIGLQNAQAQSTKNVAANIELSISSSNQQLLGFLKQHGTKLSAKTLNLGHSTQADQALNAANASSNFDTTFLIIIQNDLNAYTASLKESYAASHNQILKSQLSSDYNGAQLLLVQIKSPDS